jgi:hypothetical protein
MGDIAGSLAPTDRSHAHHRDSEPHQAYAAQKRTLPKPAPVTQGR